MSFHDKTYAWGDVDTAGADAAASYLQAAAETWRQERVQSLDKLDLGPGSWFLDAGCGLGELVLEAAARVGPGGSAIGIDLSAELIERARASSSSHALAHFEVGDITRLRFDNDTFDAIRCERVFQHLDDQSANAAVKEFLRVARPGGRISISDAVQAQHVVDCDDIGVFDAIVEHLRSHIRDPYAGIRLGRRLQTAGAAIVDFDVMARRVPFDSWSRGLAIQDRLAAVVASGAISQARADAFVEDITRRDAAGTFYAVGVGCRALATKGDSPPRAPQAASP